MMPSRRIALTFVLCATLAFQALPVLHAPSAFAGHGAQTLVPYAAADYRYRVVAHGAEVGFEQPGYDDSAWPQGAGAFGSGGTCPLQSGVQTSWTVDTDVLLRRTVQVANGTTEISIFIEIDNDVEVWWNGTRVFVKQDEACPVVDEHVVQVPGHLVQAGSNTLAVRGIDRGVESFLDLKVVAGIGVDEARTFGSCYGDLHAKKATACREDPVNTATGAFVTEVTDLYLDWVGLPFILKRSYSSRDGMVGPLGVAWTHSFAAALTFADNGDATLRGEDGQRITFVRSPDGSFGAGGGEMSGLREVTGGYELARADQVRYSFDASGHLTRIADRNGNAHAPTYDASGRLQSVVLSAATGIPTATVTFEHSPDGLLERVTLPDGRTVRYGYTSGRLVSVTDVRSGVTTYTYDANGWLKEIFDQHVPAKRVVLNIYNSATGRVEEQWVPSPTPGAPDVRWSFSWDPQTQTATVTDPRNKQWKDVYDHNMLVRRIDPLGNETKYTYDADMNRIAIEDARGNVTRMTYDGRGNMLSRTPPAPFTFTERWEYTSGNELRMYTDGRGHSTTYDYDASGNLTSITDPLAGITRFTPNVAGQVLMITDRRGKTTNFDYDAAGHLKERVSPLGHKRSWGYDDSRRVRTMVDPRGNVSGASPPDYTWTFSYNSADQMTATTDPLGHVSARVYGPTGLLKEMTNANNRTTSYEYTGGGLLRAVTAADGSVTTYGFDDSGNLTTRTDPLSRVTSYGYDDANRLVSITLPAVGTPPVSSVWRYTYDANSNLHTVTDARGNATSTPGDGMTTLGHDSLNRLTSIDYSDSTPNVTFGYDDAGNRTSMTDGQGNAESVVYDALGRPREIGRGIAETFKYTYDDAANTMRREYPLSQASVDYTFDDDGRLSAVKKVGETVEAVYGYDAADNVTRLDLPNGLVERRYFDRAGRLDRITGPSSDITYSLDPVGNPTHVVSGATTVNHEYDVRERLTRTCYGTCGGLGVAEIAWTYDAVGNRLSETRGVTSTTYAYDAMDRLTSATGSGGVTTYGYDANGSQTLAGARSFTYDMANRLRSTTLGLTTTTYDYDGLGKRVKETTTTASTGDSSGTSSMESGTESSGTTSTLRFWWDPTFDLPELMLERSVENSSVRRHYVHGHDSISMKSGTTQSYYHHERLGSVINTTSASATLQRSYDYEPWGVLRSETVHDTSSPQNLLRYTGEFFDAATSQYHLRARQYDPSIGRFMRLDPAPPHISDAFVNGFAYADNSPLVFTDPSGLFCITGTNPDKRCRGAKWVKDHGWQVAGGAVTAACVFTTGLVGASVCLKSAAALAVGKTAHAIVKHDDSPACAKRNLAADILWNITSSALFVVPGAAGGRAAEALASRGVGYALKASMEGPGATANLHPAAAPPGFPGGVAC